MKVRAFSPCHITGFFEIHDKSSDPLKIGSRGAGISIEMGVVTTVSLSKSKKNRVQVRINGREEKAPVSVNVARRFLSMVKEPYELMIDHSVLVPIGAGFGSSGAGALSLALALNEALGLSLSRIEAAKIAHLAEVECKTGLGTVIAETYGGFEIRTKPGAPEVGRIRLLPVDKDYFILAFSLGPILTESLLSNKMMKRRINSAGREAMRDFMKKPAIPSFMQISRKFSDRIRICDVEVENVLKDMDVAGFKASIAMVGKTVFTIVKEGEAEEVLALFEKYNPSWKNIVVSCIDFQGARMI